MQQRAFTSCFCCLQSASPETSREHYMPTLDCLTVPCMPYSGRFILTHKRAFTGL